MELKRREKKKKGNEMKNKRRVAPFDSPLLLLSIVTVTTGCVTGGTIVVEVVL